MRCPFRGLETSTKVLVGLVSWSDEQGRRKKLGISIMPTPSKQYAKSGRVKKEHGTKSG